MGVSRGGSKCGVSERVVLQSQHNFEAERPVQAGDHYARLEEVD